MNLHHFLYKNRGRSRSHTFAKIFGDHFRDTDFVRGQKCSVSIDKASHS